MDKIRSGISKEELWKIEEEIFKKSRALAIERVSAMNLPREIHLDDDVPHLGVATSSIYKIDLETLKEKFTDSLPSATAAANEHYWRAAWEGACWAELSIQAGTINDNAYTRQMTTPVGYMNFNGGGPNVSASRAIDQSDGAIADAFGHGENADFESLFLIMACLLFNDSEGRARHGLDVPMVMNFASHAHDFRASAHLFRGWKYCEEFAKENPKLQGEIRTNQARHAAMAKLSADPRQKEKIFVRECWEEWRKIPARYTSKAEFARDMLSKCQDLRRQDTIEQWCRDWERAFVNGAPAS